jgi:hypothetical protein
METASPAASSAGEVILEPDESRARDCERRCEDCSNCVAADCAVVFVLMTITDSFHESWMICFSGIPAACGSFKLAPAISLRRFTAAGRRYFSNPFSSVNHTHVITLDKLAIGG